MPWKGVLRPPCGPIGLGAAAEPQNSSGKLKRTHFWAGLVEPGSLGAWSLGLRDSYQKDVPAMFRTANIGRPAVSWEKEGPGRG